MGKAYANKKDVDHRNKNDYYKTPLPLVIELEKLGLIKKTDKVLECACGEAKQISGYFNSLGYNFDEKDIIYGNDFLKDLYLKNYYDFCGYKSSVFFMGILLLRNQNLSLIK